MTETYIYPDWPAPEHVVAVVTSRQGGDSEPPFEGFNLGDHVGDDPLRVEKNRQRLRQDHPGLNDIQWLTQVHGAEVVEADQPQWALTADASFTNMPGRACAVLTADCLPLLICDRQGTQVAAVHCGWRSLAAGIVANTLRTFDVPASDLLVWMGPAISQQAFEVGIDVLEAFYGCARDAEHLSAISACFKPSGTAFKFHADLYGLAKSELSACGVEHCYGGDHCTVTEAEQFYSYRRDGQTGRMASLIWLRQIK